jgi:hypothetical protein
LVALSRKIAQNEESEASAYFSKARAPLLFVPASQNRAYWEQLRAGLRRKEGFFS